MASRGRLLWLLLWHRHELLGGGEVSDERSIIPSRRHTWYTTHWASVVAVARGLLAGVKARCAHNVLALPLRQIDEFGEWVQAERTLLAGEVEVERGEDGHVARV